MTMWTNNTTYIADLNAAMPGPGQFKFPAVQNASADANTLDDYEEGTWTVGLGGSATYTGQSGTYTKWGREVKARGQMSVNAIGTGSTGTMSGLPFASAVVTSGTVGYFSGSATNYTFVSIFANSGATTIATAAIAAAAAGMTTPAVIFGNGTVLDFSVTYHV